MSNRKRLAGWLPAIILPIAATDQLVRSLLSEDVSGISVTAWFLFLLANIGSLVFASGGDRIAKMQVLIAFGITAVLDAAIVIVLLLRGSPVW